MRFQGLFLFLVLWLLVLPDTNAQREIPSPATLSQSTAAVEQRVMIQSKDFEEISDLTLTRRGQKLETNLTVRLLSANLTQYGAGIDVKVWADLNSDGHLSAGELVLSDSQFASQADADRTLSFRGSIRLNGTSSLADTTLVRAVVLYGQEPQVEGNFTFGDVVDRTAPVTVGQPAVVPLLEVGRAVKAAAFTVTEHTPGRVGPMLALVSPKGTAISLTRTDVRVTRGDIKLGRVRRIGRLTVIPVRARSSVASQIRITPVFNIRRFRGRLALRTNQSGQKVTVGNVVRPIAVSRHGGVRRVQLGAGQALAPINFRESAGGHLGGPLFLVSPKGTAISLTRSKAEVLEGDIQLGEPQQTSAANVVRIPVRKRSTQPSRIRVHLVLNIGQGAPRSIKVTSSVSKLRLLLAEIIRSNGKRRRGRSKERGRRPDQK